LGQQAICFLGGGSTLSAQSIGEHMYSVEIL